MMRYFAFILMVFLAPSAWATPKDDGIHALNALKAARVDLARATTRSERRDALTKTIWALELGMAAARDSIRSIANQEDVLFQEFKSREDELFEFMSALLMLERSPEPALILHPSGPTGAARSGMMMADLAPNLADRAREIQETAQELSALGQLQKDTNDELEATLVELQNARTMLSQAISDRTDLPLKFAEDPVKTALLLATSTQLEDFVQRLDQIGTYAAVGAVLEPGLDLPVVGRVLQRFNEPDTSGFSRPGIIVLTQPGALITAPTSATVRYQGPLLDFGQVVILEPAAQKLFIFAGLGEIFAKTGEVVNKGAPIGLMSKSIGASALAQDTLYIEVRDNQTVVDPALWFVTE